jgi:hypothetical protein
MPNNEKNEAKSAQVLVLDALNDLFNECASDNDEKRPVSIGAVVVYSDGTTTSQMAGELNRVLITGALTDLVNQIFQECRQREINQHIEDTVKALHLASLPPQNNKMN